MIKELNDNEIYINEYVFLFLDLKIIWILVIQK